MICNNFYVHVVEIQLHWKLTSCLYVRFHCVSYVQQSAIVIASMENVLPQTIALVILLGLETRVIVVMNIHIYIYMYT